MRFDQPANDHGKVEVTQTDIEKIFRVSPHYSNKFFISVSADGMVRLSFADEDSASKLMNVRTSVVIPAPAYLTLYKLIAGNMPNIQRMLVDMRDRLNITFPQPTDQHQPEKVIDGEARGENSK
jgi:hypothetical protein